MNFTTPTLVYYFIFGALTLLGGVIGYLKAKSKASLIAGVISGALLNLAGVLLLISPARPQMGLAVGIAITLLLLGRFAPAFFKTRKWMPAGMIFLLGLISLGLSILSWIKI